MKLKLTSILGATAIILGAFGAHALSETLTETELASYKTGVLYHLVHSVYLLGLIVLGNPTTLRHDGTWRAYLDWAEEHKLFAWHITHG
jgi:uncharacterized membrane protein YgdD (TMEM256/DUF423 family)